MKTMAPLGPLPEVEERSRCPLGLRGHDLIKQSFQGQKKSLPQAVPAACLGDLPSLMTWWEMGCGREGSSPPSHLPRHPMHILAPGQCQTFSIGETVLLAGHHSYHGRECGDLLISGKGSLDGAELGKGFGELVFLECLGRGMCPSPPFWPLYSPEDFASSWLGGLCQVTPPMMTMRLRTANRFGVFLPARHWLRAYRCYNFIFIAAYEDITIITPL